MITHLMSVLPRFFAVLIKIVRIASLQALLKKTGILLVAGLVAGCMGYDPLSNEVRAGGTVLVAIDAIRNRMPDELQAEAVFTDSEGILHGVKVRYLLRIQPDPISDVGLGFVTTTKGFYAGQKLAVIDMVDPTTLRIPSNPQIAEGAGILKIHMPDIDSHSEHALTILPANSWPEPSENKLRIIADVERQQIYQNNWLSLGRPLPHVIIKTEALAGFDSATPIAGVTFRLRSRNDAFNSVAGQNPFGVTKLTSDPNLQLAWQFEYSPLEEYSELLITLSNPHGFVVSEIYSQRALPKSTFNDLSSIAIGWQRQQFFGTDLSPVELIESPVFIDTNGERVAGLGVEVVRQI